MRRGRPWHATVWYPLPRAGSHTQGSAPLPLTQSHVFDAEDDESLANDDEPKDTSAFPFNGSEELLEGAEQGLAVGFGLRLGSGQGVQPTELPPAAPTIHHSTLSTSGPTPDEFISPAAALSADQPAEQPRAVFSLDL